MTNRYSVSRKNPACWHDPRGWFLRGVIHYWYNPKGPKLRQAALAAALYRTVRSDTVSSIVHFADNLTEERRNNAIDQRGNKGYFSKNPIRRLEDNPIGKRLLPLAIRAIKNGRILTLKDIDQIIAKEWANDQPKKESRRTKIIPTTQRIHNYVIRMRGGRCPCCNLVAVVDINERRISPAEYDHFNAADQADPQDTWLLCKSCHDDVTHKRVERKILSVRFLAYQESLELILAKREAAE